MKRLVFLVAGTAAALVVSAGPASADNINSPHQKTSVAAGATSNSWGGVSRCAGCHRAHTAQGAMLLKTDQESLCLTCHAGSGASNNVEDGVNGQGTALRGGGFANSAINADNPSALYYFNTSRNSVSLQEGVIPTLGSPVATTSSHGMGVSNAWGYGLTTAAGAAGLSSPLECGSCHDPHGNGNYRLLNTVPGGVSNAAMNITSAVVEVVAVTSGSTTTNYTVVTYTTDVQHYLGVGNTVTIAGVGTAFNGTFSVWATPTYTTFQLLTTQPLGTVTLTGTPTAKNAGQAVADADPALARIYTTTDYWKVNDETTPNITVGTTTNVKAFIGSIAAWCTQCHTRYQTGRSGTYANPTNDTVFTYRHRGNRVTNTNVTNNTAYPNQVNAANCIQCHVAHGSNAKAVPSTLGVMYPGTTTVEDSSLLRISNRGVCQMCHNK